MKAKLARRVKWIYIAALLLSLHYAFTVYINSNFLSQYFSAENLSLLYTAGSCITIVLFILTPSLVRRFSNARVLLTGIVLEFTALVGLYYSTDLNHLALFFLIHQAMPPLLLFGLDVFLEDTLQTERYTGRVRSMYLTVINLAFLFSPIIVGSIVEYSSYRFVYILSAIFCFLLFFVVGDELQPVRMKTLEETSFRDTIQKIAPRKGLQIVILLDFLLQSFYALMVIYMSLYLHQIMRFDWTTIGILYTIMLLPFVLFEAPLGRIFDKRKIESDTIVVGFALMSISLMLMATVHSTNFFFWAILLFVSRIGASFTEVGNEYAFFRRVTGRDAGFISLFRMTVPLAYALVPLLAQAILPYIALSNIFLIFSVILILGVFYGSVLRSAK